MNIRERIADWITGGALTLALEELSHAKNDRTEALQSMYRVQHEFGQQTERVARAMHIRTDALRRIAAEERPTSNATVRRMARIAREALE